MRLTVLPDIKPGPLKAAGDVYPVYEEACRYIEAHSQPLEHLNVGRTVDEFEKHASWFACITPFAGRHRAPKQLLVAGHSTLLRAE